MFNVSDSFIIMIIISIIIVTTLTLFSILIFFVRPMKNKIEEQSRMIFMLLKKHENQDDKLYDISNEFITLRKNITSLSTSIEEERNRKMYPTPNLAEMITITIKEQIAIESLLSHNMRSPKTASVDKIVRNVIQTYPHINEEYIVKKCISLIESASQNR